MHEFDIGDTLRQITQYVSQSPKRVAKPVAPLGGLSSNSPGHNTRSIEHMSDEELMSAYRSGKL